MHHALAAYADVLDREPETPRRLVDALHRSSAYGCEHLDDLAREYVRLYGGDVKALRDRIKPGDIEHLYSWSLTDEDKRCIQEVLAMSLGFGFIKRSLSLDELLFEP